MLPLVADFDLFLHHITAHTKPQPPSDSLNVLPRAAKWHQAFRPYFGADFPAGANHRELNIPLVHPLLSSCPCACSKENKMADSIWMLRIVVQSESASGGKPVHCELWQMQR